MLMYKERAYRSWTKSGDLVFFEVIEKETDLAIYAVKNLEKQARAAVLTYRRELEDYIKRDPWFFSSLEPLDVDMGSPEIVRAMAVAGRTAGVGPMAAIAGAVAEFVGREIGRFSDEIIVENGGDIFLRTAKKRSLGIYAGENSPFTGKLALEVGPAEEGLGVCTSSGTVSHSLSFGSSDAVVIIARDAALADAVATATGNILKRPEDVTKGIDFAKSIDGVTGVVAIIKDKLGSWGDVRFT
jgi:hypothetical protein